MLREECRNGMEVTFGRSDKAKGVILKVNITRAIVKVTEPAGKYRLGTEWNVPFGMLSTPDQVEPLQYSPFQDRVEVALLEALNLCYCELSPENLTCDGELPRDRVRQKMARLHTQIRGIEAALGRHVSEASLYDWMRQRDADCRLSCSNPAPFGVGE